MRAALRKGAALSLSAYAMSSILAPHPAHRIVCWLLLVIAAQCLTGVALALALLVMPAFGGECVRRWRQLLRRTRWLLLSLVVIFGWSVAGEPLWVFPMLPSPTVEGLQDGLVQAARLALVLSLVAVLLATTPVNDLMAGSRTLLAPLRRLGVDVDRAVVRLALVLHYAEAPPAGGWRTLLAPALPSGPGTVAFSLPRVRAADWAAVALAALLAVVACLP